MSGSGENSAAAPPVSKGNDGWTGRKCGDCRGTGEHDHQMFGRTPCMSCGGTGEEYVSLLDLREHFK